MYIQGETLINLSYLILSYLHNNWNYKVKSDTDDSPYWEELFVQVTDPTNPKSKCNVVNFYRPPHASRSHLTDFIYYFTQKLSTLNTSETTFACGDFNINLPSLNVNEHHNAYLEGILSSGLLPTITPLHICLIIALLSITYLSINKRS